MAQVKQQAQRDLILVQQINGQIAGRGDQFEVAAENLRPGTKAILAAPAPRQATLRQSVDGGTVEFATAAGLQRFSLANRRIVPVAKADVAPAVARTQAPGVVLAGWQDSNAPRLNGDALRLGRSELSRAAALLPDGGVLLGTDTHLQLFGQDGLERAATDVPAPVSAVTVTAGVAVATLLGGSVRW
jgi:hypothetical protein